MVEQKKAININFSDGSNILTTFKERKDSQDGLFFSLDYWKCQQIQSKVMDNKPITDRKDLINTMYDLLSETFDLAKINPFIKEVVPVVAVADTAPSQHEQILTYIKACKVAKMDEKTIIDAMVKAGYSEFNLKPYFKSLKDVVVGVPIPPPPPPQ